MFVSEVSLHCAVVSICFSLCVLCLASFCIVSYASWPMSWLESWQWIKLHMASKIQKLHNHLKNLSWSRILLGGKLLCFPSCVVVPVSSVTPATSAKCLSSLLFLYSSSMRIHHSYWDFAWITSMYARHPAKAIQLRKNVIVPCLAKIFHHAYLQQCW